MLPGSALGLRPIIVVVASAVAITAAVGNIAVYTGGFVVVYIVVGHESGHLGIPNVAVAVAVSIPLPV